MSLQSLHLQELQLLNERGRTSQVVRPLFIFGALANREPEPGRLAAASFA